ncbi:hypothetical protein HGH93_00450 [Chitinophaga polysaccharea]|uniref:hypothetical protein n=1 Tax=Chitinophaga TaxID=79328 RepID=UPI001455AB17|nr:MULTISPECIES: hypothetical protein [Chitinophaga]NLR56548.1 hypothetical protein [Chitinophaga polysaccharea]NLU92778.1 hypothetical protein [Chitinophaga sp. Ak27]
MQRSLLLVPIFLFACQQTATKEETTTGQPPVTTAKTTPKSVAFKLISGNTNSDTAVFEQAGITAGIANTGNGMQTIYITQQGKRLINYIRAIDSATTALPTPALVITGTDTLVSFNRQQTNSFSFKIKNNRGFYMKSTHQADSIKKAPLF